MRCLAYLTFTAPPGRPALDAAVEVEFCPVARDYRTTLGDPADRPTAFQAWGVPPGEQVVRNYRTYGRPLLQWLRQHPRVAVYEYYFKYGFRGWPMVMPRLIGMEVEALGALGLYGHNTYCEQDTWPNWEAGHYVLARLLWGGSGEGVLGDYLQARWAEAAAAVDDYLVLLENAVRRLYTGHGRRNFASVEQLGVAVVRDGLRLLREAQGHLAAAAARRPSPLLQCWRTAVEYAVAEVELRLAMGTGTGLRKAYARWRDAVLAPGMAPGRGVLLAEDYGERGEALLHLHDADLRPLLGADPGSGRGV